MDWDSDRRFLGQTMRVAIVLEHGPENWGAMVPALPGCVSVDVTSEAALENIVEAIKLHLEGIWSDLDPLPYNYEGRRLRLIGRSRNEESVVGFQRYVDGQGGAWFVCEKCRAALGIRPKR